jgi:hypothetical protein
MARSIEKAEQAMRSRMLQVLTQGDNGVPSTQAKGIVDSCGLGVSALRSLLKDVTRSHHLERLHHSLEVCNDIMSGRVC